MLRDEGGLGLNKTIVWPIGYIFCESGQELEVFCEFHSSCLMFFCTIMSRP